MSSRQLIRMRGIVKRFYIGQPNELEILHGIDLDVKEGEFVSIVGASGSGKSTLMNMIGVLDRPTEGTYWLDGTDVQDAQDDELSQIRNRKIGFVFQNFNLISRTNARKNVELPMMYAGIPQKKRTQRAEELLDLVGMADRMDHQPNELSGGQKQRVAIARALVNRPQVLLLDEPTSQLDPIAATDFLSTLGRINRELGTTIILSEHRLEDALALSTNVVFLERGRILDTGTASEVGSRLKAAGSDMFSAMPVPMRIYAGVPNDLPCPVTVAQGRQWLEAFSETHPLCPVPPATPSEKREGPAAVELDEAFFRYDKQSPDVVKALTLRAYPGELLAILGGNGTGN